GCIAALSTPLVQAQTESAPQETGSNLLFNAKIAQLQCEIRVRNQLADELVRSQLAQGYSAATSEELAQQGKTMLSRADNDAFAKEMENLREMIALYELRVCGPK
ncbi:MAG TPA: hypothetical protein VIZ86_06630, partial [Pseudomonas sp.]